MSLSDFYKVMPIIMRDEGGYSNDPNDAGNWTGGSVGSGTLLGTNFGISASTYPDLDIPNLTQDDAQAIFLKDWWEKYHFDLLPSPYNMKVFDIGINCGAKVAIRELQQALAQMGYAVIADGVIGPMTEAAASGVTYSLFWPIYTDEIEDHYESVALASPRCQKYLRGWLARADEVMPS
jgi:lysozyme family protein